VAARTDALKLGLHRAFRALGFDIAWSHHRGPEPPVSGTFAPHEQYFLVGKAENYFIHDGYKHRTEINYFNDTSCTDEWQREVYRFAREIFDAKGLSRVCDVGCGSAFKLLRCFADCDIVGFDVKTTCEWLRSRYPAYSWFELDFKTAPPVRGDLVIASDVIEHVLYPEELLSYILALDPKYIVLSTPDRNLLGAGTHDGPPRNPTHVREWSYAELQAYIGSHFKVLEHFISNGSQSTQCLLCAPRG